MKTRCLMLGLAVAAISCLVSPTHAHAGVWDIFGFGARNIAMGGAATATADDHTATFYNPAGLTRRKVIQVGLGVAGYIHEMAISHRNPGQENLEARAPESPYGVSLGVVFPLGGKIENRIALGIGLYVPIARALKLEALDPATPRWYRYQTLADKLHIAASVAAEVTDWFAFGVGIQALADLEGDVDLGIDLTNQRIRRRDATIELITTASPIVGLLFTPIEGWRVGLNYRAAVELEYDIPLRFDFGEAIDLMISIDGNDLYTPHTFSLGTAYTIASIGLTLALDGEVALWSLAPDPSLNVRVEGQGELIEELGLGDYLDIQPGRRPDPGFKDTVTMRVGAEYQPLDALLLRLGYLWRQAALGLQTGTTTYLDSDSHTVSLGGAVTFPDPMAVDDLPVTIDLAAQVTVHPDATVDKADPGNPVGAVSYGGFSWGLALSLRHDL